MADSLIEHHSADNKSRWQRHPLSDKLAAEAKRRGLYNLWIPPHLLIHLMHMHPQWDWKTLVPHCSADRADRGAFSNLDYAFLAQESGRGLFCAEALNCSAPDTGNMEILGKFGSASQHDQYLHALLKGDARSCFGMTEPAVSSSDPTQLAATATATSSGGSGSGDNGLGFVVRGNKWWTTGACDARCSVCIYVARTGLPSDHVKDPREVYQQHSLLLVPMKSAGVRVIRPLTVFGFDDAPGAHAEVAFDGVRVGADALLGELGKGFQYAQIRLGPGRLHHCARLLGMGERALQAVVLRGTRRTAFGRPLLSLGGNS
jgi:alkylation response protein AidB-like acyl-CoA dehydrogenase